MKVKSYNGSALGEAEVDCSAFGERVLYRTLKEAVLSHMANQRQGTASTKGRSEVKGTNKKPYKQKHTGRARAGDRKSPIWRGGGTVFGPRPRDYSYHLPKKAKRVALRSAIAGKLADGEVIVTELKGFDAPSSKTARAVLSGTGVDAGRACVVVRERNESIYRSFRNFPRVSVRTAEEVNAFDLTAGGTILVEPGVLEALAKRVGSKQEVAS